MQGNVRVTTEGARILIVDDEKGICDILYRLLDSHGFRPMVAHDGESALEMIRLGIPDLVVSDVRMPGMDGLELLRRVKKHEADLPVIMITGWGGIEGAVEALKQGASDYLTKPVDSQELVNRIRQALEAALPPSLAHAHAHNGDGLAPAIVRLHEMMGPSESVRGVISEVALVARSGFSVIIQGETGTGKELVAEAIHKASSRASGPMIPVDCGAIPESLFESELFGHEKGAFTGAISSNPGKFELAQGGTLFLDEIGNMPLHCQIKLLRSIQERTFYRVGGRRSVSVNFRLIVASNQDLNEAVAKGSFSRDLFYRLSEFTIQIRPIRERKEDIIHLANRFLQATNVELAKKVKGFSQAAISTLMSYGWPGNIRQLRSAVRRAVLQADEWIEPENLALEAAPEAPATQAAASGVGDWNGLSLKEIVRDRTMEVERTVLTDVLRRTGGNKAKAARLLKIDYTTLHAKIKLYGISIDADVPPKDI
jgi:two-component system nitrogen regulation response regulator GlnG